MLLLLLAYAQVTSCSPIASIAISTSVLSTSVTCESADSTRTLFNIIWSALATIFACVWTAVHRNIPGPSQGRLSRILDMVLVVVVTLLVPEWVLAGAVRQYLNARDLGKELEAARADAAEVWEAKRQSLREMKGGEVDGARDGHATDSKDPSAEVLVEVREKDVVSLKRRTTLPAKEAALAESTLAADIGIGRLQAEWTTRHGFFIIMGGFHFYEDGKPLFPLSGRDIVELVKAGDLIPPTEEEIRGWSQGDALSKLIAIVQTLWFVIQCIARRAEDLPIAQLEIMTLAYTTITVAMYICWWYKPLNVNGPVRIAGKTLPDPVLVEQSPWYLSTFEAAIGSADRLVDLRQHSHVPTFYCGGPAGAPIDGGYSGLSGSAAVVASMIFGAVHCAAWNYVFPSTAESLIWRISSAIIVAVPGAMSITALIASTLKDTALAGVSGANLVAVFAMGGPAYVAARMLLLTLSFTTLRALPPGAYQAVQWTLKIPHFT
ncbi:hypothetical protein BV25DRAFT_1919910 [Artomyces pyxidatus]|uniref:Uncharacterized protein n=1 Tax=Artomyces pyxidatus TaxID=48021 RepID=A0ACB8SPR0_9AGAM|nr:hypothetical protein BV25DRAFT_1919910 [Artomyces pyxidatus]